MKLKSKRLMVLSRFSIRWIAAALAAFFFAFIGVSSVHASGGETVEAKYPGLSMGVLKSARLVEMNPSQLLAADGFEIPKTWIDETVQQFPQEARKQIAGSLFFMLEQEVTQKVVVRDAKIAGIPSEGLTEDQIIESYLSRKVGQITVSEAEAQSFYEENKELVGGLPFDQVKESIHGFLTQQKQQDAVYDYIRSLENLKDIRINRQWVEKQYALAMDNPVDRARGSGKPTLVEFGATGCVPCDMMQPILDKLKKTRGDRLNVVFVNVRDDPLLGARFGIRSIPVQVFYDRSGKEVFRHVGFFAEAEVDTQLSHLGVR